MTDILSLARRVEEATGADRELDALIALACVPEVTGWVRHPNHETCSEISADHLLGELWPSEGGFYAWLHHKENIPCFQAPRYTASIDAAMTLVPEGWDGALYLATGDHKPQVQLETPAMRLAFTMEEEMAQGSAATLPLAITAAALRARAAQGKGS